MPVQLGDGYWYGRACGRLISFSTEGAESTRRLTDENPPMSSSKELQLEGSALGGSTGAHPEAVVFISGDAQFGGTKSTTEDEEEMLFRCGKP
jgi:hypothetical protein